jgi:hypothetical protein
MNMGGCQVKIKYVVERAYPSGKPYYKKQVADVPAEYANNFLNSINEPVYINLKELKEKLCEKQCTR